MAFGVNLRASSAGTFIHPSLIDAQNNDVCMINFNTETLWSSTLHFVSNFKQENRKHKWIPKTQLKHIYWDVNQMPYTLFSPAGFL